MHRGAVPAWYLSVTAVLLQDFATHAALRLVCACRAHRRVGVGADGIKNPDEVRVALLKLQPLERLGGPERRQAPAGARGLP